MSNLLTPHEALQALIDGKRVEVRWSTEHDWEVVLTGQMIIDELIDPEHQFRLAQETIIIGDVSFPKPISEPLESGTEYWVAEPSYQHYTALGSSRWEDDNLDRRCLRRGLIHLTKENAIAHAKALIKLSGGNVDE